MNHISHSQCCDEHLGAPTVQFSSVDQSCATLCDPMNCSMPGFPVHHQLLELAQTHVYRVGDAIQPSHLLLTPSPHAFNFSQHQGFFQWVSSLHQVAKYWSFTFSISLSNEYSGLISFRFDWFDLLTVQGIDRELLIKTTHLDQACLPELSHNRNCWLKPPTLTRPACLSCLSYKEHSAATKS